ncbi:MAG TPA: serine/threonine protein phosphatase, partial [Rhodospirillales bacterium]|nr:serine/threonine protein phosphatase [Rhodospirillales bacterium]
MILNIFRKRERVTLDTARVPDKTRIYVVGDIHGRADLLKHLHKLILKDSAKVTSDVRKVIVFLGDYIDRGLQSKEVIDFLLDNPLKGFEAVFLKGNHEEQFLNFLNDVNLGSQWLRIGGNAMVHSYGMHIQESLPPEDRLPRLRRDLNDTFPKRHLD